jgi:hypothetical protein
MDTALYMVLSVGFAVSLLTCLALNWKIHTQLYSAQDRLSVLEGIVTREVKIRASNERWNKVRQSDSAIEAALASGPVQPPKKVPWYRDPRITRLRKTGTET